MHSTRRGRPKQQGERYPSGDLVPERDTGTPEQLEKRQALVGRADDQRASYPLGILYARRIILRGDHYAGRRYAALFYGAVRPLTMPTMLADLVARGHMPLAMSVLAEAADEERGAELRAQYLAARAVIERAGNHVAKAVDDVCVYEHPPRSQKTLEALKDGLDALARHFDVADERRQAA